MAGDRVGETEKTVTKARKERLWQYIFMQGELRDLQENLSRLENNCYLPAPKVSDGSKKSPGASDRMANATIRYLAYKEKVEPDIERIKAEMAKLEQAVSALPDGLERRVMRLRYLTADEGSRQHIKWPAIAIRIYGDDDQAQLQAVHRIHGNALLNIQLEGSTE